MVRFSCALQRVARATNLTRRRRAGADRGVRRSTDAERHLAFDYDGTDSLVVVVGSEGKAVPAGKVIRDEVVSIRPAAQAESLNARWPLRCSPTSAMPAPREFVIDAESHDLSSNHATASARAPAARSPETSALAHSASHRHRQGRSTVHSPVGVLR